MSIINAIIIDDEIAAQEVLQSLLARNCPQVNVVAIASNLPLGAELIKLHHPDLVFLDVQMPSFYGYEIFRFFDKIDFEIIFTTAYHQYAIKAFELSALDYLLKPIRIERLKQAVDKSIKQFEINYAIEQLAIFNDYIEKKRSSALVLRDNKKQTFIEIDQIMALKAESSYCRILMKNGDQHLSSKNLKNISELLDGWDQFYRCHKSWVVNTSCVNAYERQKCNLILKNGLIVKVSRSKRIEIMAVLKKNRLK